MDCIPTSCEAHLYMSEGVKEIKTMSSELSRGQQALENSMIKLTENFSEMQRLSLKLEAVVISQDIKNAAQDEVIGKQRDFMNKAMGVLGVLTMLVPILSALLGKYFK